MGVGWGEAEQVVLSVLDTDNRAAALRGLAQALAATRQYRRSLGILGARSLDNFLNFLTDWYKGFNGFGVDNNLLYQQLHVRILKIMDWVRIEYLKTE